MMWRNSREDERKPAELKPKKNTWNSHKKAKSGSYNRRQHEEDAKSNSEMSNFNSYGTDVTMSRYQD